MEKMLRLLHTVLNRNFFERCLVRGGLYRNIVRRAEIEKYQANCFNCVWKDAFQNLRFYTCWKKKHGLPDSINSLTELYQWPVITKKELQKSLPEDLSRPGIKPTGQLMTGGSTGEPMRLGTWPNPQISPSLWLGRAAYGILPGDRTFHLWGHAHLYGKGFSRRIKITRQYLKDRLTDRFRFPAYDLSEAAMDVAFRKCEAFSPKIFMGFSAAVLTFCRINRALNRSLSCPVHAVLCTAGPLSLDEQKEISDYFHAPLCMEYGSADCSVMAYTVPDGGYYTSFWDTHLLQGMRDDYGEIRNIVTRLTQCYFPIIRYEIGDYLDLEEDEPLQSILRIKTVKGRPSDVVILDNNVSFFGAVIGDCIKQVPGIISGQLSVEAGRLRIDAVAMKKITDDDKILIVTRLRGVVQGLQNYPIDIRQVDSLFKTKAGKIPLVIRDAHISPTQP